MQKQTFREETNTAPRYDSETVRQVLARASDTTTVPPPRLAPQLVQAMVPALVFTLCEIMLILFLYLSPDPAGWAYLPIIGSVVVSPLVMPFFFGLAKRDAKRGAMTGLCLSLLHLCVTLRVFCIHPGRPGKYWYGIPLYFAFTVVSSGVMGGAGGKVGDWYEKRKRRVDR